MCLPLADIPTLPKMRITQSEKICNMITREPLNSDWKTIAALADLSVTHISGAPKQAGWVQKRLEFEGTRLHHVIESAGRVVGYGSIENPAGDNAEGYRLFLVLEWTDKSAIAIAEELLARLREDVERLKITAVWVREYAEDRPFIDFLLSRGFDITKEYDYEGQALINLQATEQFLAA